MKRMAVPPHAMKAYKRGRDDWILHGIRAKSPYDEFGDLFEMSKFLYWNNGLNDEKNNRPCRYRRVSNVRERKDKRRTGIRRRR